MGLEHRKEETGICLSLTRVHIVKGIPFLAFLNYITWSYGWVYPNPDPLQGASSDSEVAGIAETRGTVGQAQESGSLQCHQSGYGGSKPKPVLIWERLRKMEC